LIVGNWTAGVGGQFFCVNHDDRPFVRKSIEIELAGFT
jgi:hypothetical protein